MTCPECGAEDRHVIKDGHTHRKTVVGPGNTAGAKIKAYRCTKCGYRSRGLRFNLPEMDEEEQQSPSSLPEQEGSKRE